MKEQLTDTYRPVVVPMQVLEDERLSSSEKLVYVVLRSFTNAHKAEAFPAVPLIAKLASLSVRQVQRVMIALEEKGYITRSAQFNYDPKKKMARQTSNLYTLALPANDEGVTPCHRGGDTMSPEGVTPCHRGGDTMSPDRYQSNSINQEVKDDDDDRHAIIESIFEEHKTEITRESFNDVVDRVMKRSVPNFEGYLKKSVKTQIENNKVAASEEKPVKRKSGTNGTKNVRKPKMAVVQTQETDGVTAEELEEMRKLALKLDSSH